MKKAAIIAAGLALTANAKKGDFKVSMKPEDIAANEKMMAEQIKILQKSHHDWQTIEDALFKSFKDSGYMDIKDNAANSFKRKMPALTFGNAEQLKEKAGAHEAEITEHILAHQAAAKRAFKQARIKEEARDAEKVKKLEPLRQKAGDQIASVRKAISDEKRKKARLAANQAEQKDALLSKKARQTGQARIEEEQDPRDAAVEQLRSNCAENEKEAKALELGAQMKSEREKQDAHKLPQNDEAADVALEKGLKKESRARANDGSAKLQELRKKKGIELAERRQEMEARRLSLNEENM